jgi:hypothetical protein
MRKIWLAFFIPLFMMSCDPKDFQKAMDLLEDTPLSNADVASGLKQALQLGVGESVNFLSAKDGFYKSAYKILLPSEARKVTDKLKAIPGFSNVESVLIEKINRGAEDAAKQAGPIFVSAIKGISFDDAMNILMGDRNAATSYLHTRTNTQLYSQFKPEIINSLDKFNALGYWADAVNTYNKIPFIDKVNPDLADYVTSSALTGLFDLVEKKEDGIRTDVTQRSSDLLKKVFAKQDN